MKNSCNKINEGLDLRSEWAFRFLDKLSFDKSLPSFDTKREICKKGMWNGLTADITGHNLLASLYK